jgi:hypothetical protein
MCEGRGILKVLKLRVDKLQQFGEYLSLLFLPLYRESTV